MALNMLCSSSCLIFLTSLLTGGSLPILQMKKQEGGQQAHSHKEGSDRDDSGGWSNEAQHLNM